MSGASVGLVCRATGGRNGAMSDPVIAFAAAGSIDRARNVRLGWRAGEPPGRGGGTGRRDGLKHRWGQPRASSNLALGTTFPWIPGIPGRCPSATVAMRASVRGGSRCGITSQPTGCGAGRFRVVRFGPSRVTRRGESGDGESAATPAQGAGDRRGGARAGARPLARTPAADRCATAGGFARGWRGA